MGRSVDDPQQYGSVMIKDEAACIRCGYCAKRCPTGCITMQEWTMQEEALYA
jgi:ferredoxin